MSGKRPPRIDWGKLTKTTGTSRMLTDGAADVAPVTISRNQVVRVAGLQVQITSITRNGAEVSFTGRVLRQVKS